MRMRRTAAALLLAGMVGGTWVLASPGASAVQLGPVTGTTPPVPVTAPIAGTTVSTVVNQVTAPTLPPVTAPTVAVPTVSAPTVTVPTVPALPVPVPVSVPDVLGAVQDCASFATQQAAQAALAVNATLAAVLDDDRDGVACELLPSLPALPLPLPLPGGAPAPTGGSDSPTSGGSSSGLAAAGARAGAGAVAAAPGTAGPSPASDGSAPAASSASAPSSGGSFTAAAPTGSAVRQSSDRTAAAAAAAPGARTESVTLASSPQELAAERADGDARKGNVAVTVLAALLVLGTAAGAFRQWKADGSLLPG